MEQQKIIEYLTIGHTLDGFNYKNLQPLSFTKQTDITLNEINKAFLSYLKQFEGKPVGVMLSAGKDSRLLIEMCKHLDLDVIGLTVGYDMDMREYDIAKRVCNRLGVSHCFIPIQQEMYDKKTLERAVNLCRGDLGATPGFDSVYEQGFFKMYGAVINGSFVTDTLREKRFYRQGDGLCRIMKNIVFDDIVKPKYRNSVRNKTLYCYQFGNVEDTALAFINNGFLKIADTTRDLFNFECPIFDNGLLDMLWSIPENDTVIRLLKRFYPSTFNIPGLRSPFPIGFPWQLHYSYRVFRNILYKTRKGINGGGFSYGDAGAWCGHEETYHKWFKEILESHIGLLDDMEFLDMKRIREKLREYNNVDYVRSFRRLINLCIWKEQTRGITV